MAAHATPIQFNIPAGPLATSLIAFTAQSGIQVTIPPDLAGARQAPAVLGALEPSKALGILIGPALQAIFVDPTTVVIQAVPPPGAAPTKAAAPPVSPELEELVVTGTRIHGVTPAGSELVTIDREAIDQSGYGTTAEILQSLTQNVAAGATEANTAGVGLADDNADWGTGINLRGLGTTSTLVLLDGRRIAPGGYGSFVDVSTIPLGAIDHVEILPDGASALYGSDAVGGVVNIHLRRDYDGAESSLRYGGGDGYNQERADQMLGLSWDSGNALFGYQYSHRGALAASARDYYTPDLTQFGGSDLRVPDSAPGNIIANGTTYAIPANQNGRHLSASSLIAGTENLADQYQGADILPDQVQNSFMLSLHQDIEPGISLFGEGYFTERDFRAQLGSYGTVIVVPKSNPFFVSPVAGAVYDEIEYAFAHDIGNMVNSGRVFDYTGTAGADLDLPYDWKAEVAGSYSVDDEQNYQGNLVNSYYLQKALADTNPATAFNPFGSGGDSNRATLNSIRGSINDYMKAAIRSADFSLDGPIFSVPGGDVRLAVGTEYRDETLIQAGEQFYDTPDLVQQTPDHLGRRVEAVYGEMFLPIVGDDNRLPGLYSLSLSAAGRVERYSDFGTTGNPKLGLTWAPVEGLSLRGTWGTSFQAPLLSELDTSQNAWELYPLPDSSSRTGRTETLIYVGGGNANLQPQTATSWTAGLDYQPPSLKGLKLSADYFNINYTNMITTLGEGLLSVLDQQNIYASLITRHPSAAQVNQIFASSQFVGVPIPASQVGAIVDGNPTNLGVLQERGIDFSAAYAFDTEFGTFNVQAGFTYTLNYKIAESPTASLVEQVSTLNNPVDFRMRDSIGWSKDGADVVLYLNYVDGYKNTTVTPSQGVDPWTTVDVHLAYHPTEAPWLGGLTVSLDVQNLFDADPPFVNNQSGYGYDPVNANALGRVVSLQLTKKW